MSDLFMCACGDSFCEWQLDGQNVICPDCQFGFHSMHKTGGDNGDYSCPICYHGENKLTEKYILKLIQEKMDSSALDGDCYLGVFYFRCDGILNEDISLECETLRTQLKYYISSLNIDMQIIIIPDRNIEHHDFKIYSLMRKK